MGFSSQRTKLTTPKRIQFTITTQTTPTMSSITRLRFTKDGASNSSCDSYDTKLYTTMITNNKLALGRKLTPTSFPRTVLKFLRISFFASAHAVALNHNKTLMGLHGKIQWENVKVETIFTFKNDIKTATISAQIVKRRGKWVLQVTHGPEETKHNFFDVLEIGEVDTSLKWGGEKSVLFKCAEGKERYVSFRGGGTDFLLAICRQCKALRPL